MVCEPDGSIGARRHLEDDTVVQLREVSPDELGRITAAHEEWLKSEGERGARATFCFTNLAGMSLESLDLTGADLTGAVLYRANLKNTKLNNVDGLVGKCLAGADLTNAELPAQVRQFESLGLVAEACKLARPILLTILVVSLYALLTVLSTTDTALVVNAPTLLIPNVNVPTPTASSYRIAPFLILFLYVYFLLYLHTIWRLVSTLPATFPDGAQLHEKVHPWLLNDVIRVCTAKPPRNGRTRHGLSSIFSILLAWGMAPLMLALLWIRYLPRHDWAWTLSQMGCLVIAIGFGLISYRRSMQTLRGEFKDTPGATADSRIPGYARVTGAIARYAPVIIGTGVSAVVVSLVSFGAIEKTPGGNGCNFWSWVQSIPQGDFGTCANLAGVELSTRPTDWWKAEESTKDSLNGIAGAKLRNSDLRHAAAEGAFLAKADLRGARLQRADLRRADLRKADIRGANLKQAALTGAILHSAKLSGEDTCLQQAILSDAQLEGADLVEVDLRNANLRGANLRGVNLEDADLAEAEVSGADLEEAKLGGAELQKAFLVETNLRAAHLDGAKLQEAFLTSANLQDALLGGAKLQGAQLKEANLVGAQLNMARLEGADLGSANLQNVHLGNANLEGANLLGAENLAVEQICKAKTLYAAHLDHELMRLVEKQCPDRVRSKKSK
jgi:uncharacterized protein YjbI with pentapeptide repeats